MRKARLLFCVQAALLVLLGLGACRQSPGVGQTEEGALLPGAVEASDTLHRGVLLAGRTLVLEGLSGRVSLQGADVDVARLTFIRVGRGAPTRRPPVGRCATSSSARRVRRGVSGIAWKPGRRRWRRCTWRAPSRAMPAWSSHARAATWT
ncbi:hypothetical protein [Rhodothermus marinus]|nr:hypothetical protein [Rhodothermus marinus]